MAIIYRYENGLSGDQFTFAEWDDLAGKCARSNKIHNIGREMPSPWRKIFDVMKVGSSSRLPSGSILFKEEKPDAPKGWEFAG